MCVCLCCFCFTFIHCLCRLGRHSKSVNLTTARCPFCLGYVHHVLFIALLCHNAHTCTLPYACIYMYIHVYMCMLFVTILTCIICTYLFNPPLSRIIQCIFTCSRLELEPRLNADGTPASVKLNRYAQFVKEHYAEVKQKTPQGGHKAVMQRLRDQYYSSSSRTPTPHLDGSFSS